MHNAKPTVEAGLLECDPKRLRHDLHQCVHGVLQYLAQGIAVTVQCSCDQIALDGYSHDSICQIAEPLAHEHLYLDLQQLRAISAVDVQAV